MYHQIGGHDRYSISEYDFTRQIFALFQRGFRTLVPGELPEAPAGQGNYVMITFDDGFESDYRIAFPVLKKYGFRGVSFITTGFIGRPGYMDWGQVRALAGAGFSVQSHTHSHRLLNTMDEKDLLGELRRSSELIEKSIGRTVTSLALPGGGRARQLVPVMRSEGYAHLFTSVPRVNPVTAFSAGEWGRVLITGDTSLPTFLEIITGDRQTYRKMLRAYLIRRTLKELVGPALYHFLWRRYYKYRSGDDPTVQDNIFKAGAG
jgi:peptidoglycan/xylan/chitin deacetylase (PgdA/CDA1 family)